MNWTERTVAGWVKREAFRVSPQPYLVLDRQLRIRAVNPAYERATLQRAEALLGEYMFDAFPDNPAAPEAHAVANLSGSLETVFRLGTRHRMPIQRYDVPSPDADGGFVRKVWAPVNAPLCDGEGTVTAVLHHVQDVTAALDRVQPAADVAAGSRDAADLVGELVTALAHEQEAAAELRAATENLRVALETSREIGMAMGIVMYSHKVTADVAFALLRGASQRQNRKLRTLAAEVVERGCIGQPS